MASQTLEPCPEHKLAVAIEHEEKNDRIQRGQWLRAAILGANDGLVSTTSLMLGIGAAKEDKWPMVLSGIAGAVAGACSMAVGEYVSVSTQRDIEKIGSVKKSEAKLNQSQPNELPVVNGTHEMTKKSPIPSNVRQSPCSPRSPMMKVISEQGPEERNDGGEDPLLSPIKAAFASALAFLCGAFLPLLTAILVDDNRTRVIALAFVTSLALAMFGAVGARLGGSPVHASARRVLVGGWLAMAITYGLLKPFDHDNKTENE